MRYFLGMLGLVSAFLLITQPDRAVEILATALLVSGILALIPEYDE